MAQSLRDLSPLPAVDVEDIAGLSPDTSWSEESLKVAREFEVDGQVAHLDTAITWLRRLLDVSSTKETKPENSRVVHALGTVLCRRFEQRTLPADIDDALRLLRDGLAHLEDVDYRIPMLVQLATALLLAFRARGNSALLDEALQLGRDAAHLCPLTSKYRCAVLHNLARVLFASYRLGSSELLDECLLFSRQGLQHCMDRSAHEPEALHDLGLLLAEKYRLAGTTNYWEESEEMLASCRRRYSECHPDLAIPLSDIGFIFALRQFVDPKAARDEKAAILADEALKICPIDHLARSSVLQKLTTCFEARWHATHDVQYIKKTEDCARAWLALCPPGHQGRLESLNGLATALRLYILPYGENALVGLEEAILLYREALSSMPFNNDWLRYSTLLRNLANTLISRYNMLGHIGDLEEAIEYFRGCLKHLEPGNIFYPARVFALAQSLSVYGARTHLTSILEEAMILLQDLLTVLNHDHSWQHAQALGLLGGILLERFVQTSSLSDLHGGIQHLEDSMKLPQFSADSSGGLCVMLGRGHAIRYVHLGNDMDADAALSYFEKGVSRYQPGDTWHTPCLLASVELRILRDDNCLSSDLAMIYDELTRNGKSGATGELLPMFASILEHTGQKGIPYFLENAGLAHQILEIHSALLPILTEMAFIGMSVSSRLTSLTYQDTVFASAIGYGRACGQVEKAVGIIEHSRSVFWGQALHLRARMYDVPEDIRVEMLALVRELELSTYTPEMQLSTAESMPKFQLLLASLNVSVERRRQGNRFKALLATIRAMPGFERFLFHEEFDTLKYAAREGPVVLLVDSALSCDALILRTCGDLISVPLSAINQAWIVELRKSWDGAMIHARSVFRDAEDAERLKLATKRKGAAKEAQEHVMHELWKNIVQPVITALDLKKSTGKARPRLWWCCNGTFAFLPIHAAGDTESRCSDYVVSSYIPTLGSLLRARKEFTHQSRANMKVLLAAVSIDDLPTTIEEISTISRIIPKEAHIPLPAAEDSRHADFAGGVTVDTVLQNTPNANILHLACHGTQDTEDPLNSGFVLRDGKLTIARLMPVPLPRAFFAFMSACETAKGDAKYANQTIHLGAAMLFAGFKSVVGTMWSMGDVDGPVVAKTVYERLFEGDGKDLDPNTIPYALDEAAQILRERGHPPGRWATYIHLGM